MIIANVPIVFYLICEECERIAPVKKDTLKETIRTNYIFHDWQVNITGDDYVVRCQEHHKEGKGE